MEYRKAKEQDLQSIGDFLSRKEIDKGFVKPLSERTISIRERVLNKSIDGDWLIALDRGSLVGCLAVIHSHHYMEISTFAVDSECRGQGIGSKLIEEAIEYTRELNYRFLDMDSWEGNDAVAVLMKKYNFKLIKSFDDTDKRPVGIKTLYYRRSLKDGS